MNSEEDKALECVNCGELIYVAINISWQTFVCPECKHNIFRALPLEMLFDKLLTLSDKNFLKGMRIGC